MLQHNLKRRIKLKYLETIVENQITNTKKSISRLNSGNA